MEDAFVLMEAALALGKENKEADNPSQAVYYLPDGDVHVCRGALCPFVTLNDDKCYVCALSGVVFGALSVREDFSTGRQAGSSNPV